MLIDAITPFLKEPLCAKREEDDMNYVWAERAAIRGDHIHLVTSNMFERLAYSYAFAQVTCVKTIYVLCKYRMYSGPDFSPVRFRV